MRIAYLTLVLLCMLMQNGISQNRNSISLRDIPLTKHFDVGDYKGGIQSWSFDQDSSGILYVANNEGLLEFDGVKWAKYEVPLCTRVRAVKVDEQNRIFVGGQGQIGYFTTTENGLVFSSLLKDLPPGFQNVSETWKIIEHDKKIFFNTESQLFVLEGNELHMLGIPGYIRLMFIVDDRMLVQIYDKGLFEFVNNEFVNVAGTKDLPDIISIISKDDVYYYFSRSGKLFRHDELGVREIILEVNLGSINDVANLSSGEYAIGTQNKGLFFLNTDFSFKQRLTKKEGLSDRTIKSLYEDEFNNLWVALNNGIDYLKLSLPLTLINEEVGLEGTGYAASYFEEQIYLGTNNGLFVQTSISKDLLDRKYNLLPESDGQVYNFSVIKDELILNHNNGAFQIIDGNLKRFHEIGSWKFLETMEPGLILGGDYQGISFFRKKNDKWLKVRVIPGLNESSRIMEFENDSTLWMTHGSKGAYRLLFDKNMNLKGDIQHYDGNSNLPSNIKISVYSLNDKLVFTAEKGMFNFNQDSYTFSPNSFFNKWLGTNHVSSIVSNGGNTIYYIQDQKLGLLIQEAFGSYKKETGLFKHINKLLNDDLPNITLLDDQNVLIGAKEGFIRYNPNKKTSMNDNFHLLIRSIEITSSRDSSAIYYPSFIEDKEITINESIKFQFAAPYFDGFENLKYSYRLTPLEEKWSVWKPLGEKDYPYLPYGDYTFEVKGLNIYGIESPIVSYSFKVLKPWYYSNLAVLIYSLIGLIILALIPLIQRRRHRTEKSIIYRSKEQALNEKNEEINQISKETKSEIQRLNNEKLRTEIDSKNDQLTTITLHLMNNNEFMQDVRKKIETNLNNNGSSQDFKKIIKTIDENLSNNDSWDRFEYHFDQVHGDYLKKLSQNNIKLSPREIKLAAFLRMNMSSKEISNLMNITTRGVELARHRLRKKLKLDRDQNLVEYLIDLDND